MSMMTKMAAAYLRGMTGRPLPVKMTCALTYSCNSRCRMCDIWKMASRRQELSVEQWKEVLRQAGRSVAWIEFSGGEPLLKKGFADIVHEAFLQKNHHNAR